MEGRASMRSSSNGILAEGKGEGAIYRALRDAALTSGLDPEGSEKAGKLRKKDEIVVLEWALFAGSGAPVMRIRSADGWCTERAMDGALNLEHVHGQRVGQSAESAAAEAGQAGRRRSISQMSPTEKQAMRRQSVEIAMKEMQTHMAFRDGKLGAPGRSMSARRLLPEHTEEEGGAGARSIAETRSAAGARRLARAQSSREAMGSIHEDGGGGPATGSPLGSTAEEGVPPATKTAKKPGKRPGLAERLAARKAAVEEARAESVKAEEERASARRAAAELAAEKAAKEAEEDAARKAAQAARSRNAGSVLRQLAASRGLHGTSPAPELSEEQAAAAAVAEKEWAAAAEAAVVAARAAEAAEQRLDAHQERVESYLRGVSDDNPFKLAVTEPAFVRQLASTLKERSIGAGELLITKGEVGEDMFFITAGCVT